MKIQLKDILDYVTDSFAAKARDTANDAVTRHVIYSMGAGLVPLPLIDVAAVSTVQLSLIRRLCEIYNVEYSESVGKSLLAALVGGTAARVGASLIKGIPVVGFLVGGVSLSIMAGASTYAVGQVFISHLEAEGSLDNFNIDAWRRAYEQQLERGKEIAARLQKQQNQKKSASKAANDPAATGTKTSVSHPVDDLFDKIERLNELRERGILTDEEFQAKKSSLLQQI